ncbi:MAG: hypothetical protein FWF51_06180 [Chitinivibrionia bacterium]|nr:hypothetical protein [Chitinivibrionia bacterium]
MKKGTSVLKVLSVTLMLSSGLQAQFYDPITGIVAINEESSRKVEEAVRRNQALANIVSSDFNEITRISAVKTEAAPILKGNRVETAYLYELKDLSEQEFRTLYEIALLGKFSQNIMNVFENLKEDFDMVKSIKSDVEQIRQLKNIREREINLCKAQDTPRCAKLKEINDDYNNLIAALDSQWKLYAEVKQNLGKYEAEFEAQQKQIEAQEKQRQAWAYRIYNSMKDAYAFDPHSLKKGIKLIFKTNDGEIVFEPGIPLPKLEESYNVQGKVIKFTTIPKGYSGEGRVQCEIEGVRMFSLEENKKKGVLEKIHMSADIYRNDMGYMGFGFFDVK